MRVKMLLWIFSYLLFQITVLPGKTGATDPEPRWSVRMAESLISTGWYQGIADYVYATAMKGFRNLWQATGNERYLQYINGAVDADSSYYQNIVNRVTHDIDYVNGGSLILFIYSQTGESKYQSAGDSTLKFLKSFPRTSDSGFYHKDWPRMQVDDLYMGSPFLAEYGQIFDSPEEYKDAVKQAIVMEKHTRDSVTGLYYHAWYETEYQGYEAGCTPIFWGRGMGWVAMALVDILDFLPEDYSGRDSVIAVFQRFAEAISKVQDNTTGVWWQVLDQGGRAGNFLESSGSCMFIYALAKGIRLGYIDDSYWDIVEKGYQGILDNFIRENEDGTVSITNVCPGQSPGYDYVLYVREAYEDGHAAGPFIMASVEIEMRGLPPSNLRAVTISDKQINLSWKDNSDDEDGFRIERASEGNFSEIAVVDANTESYHDTTLSPLTAYMYRIRMYKGDTNSIYSEKVTGITLAENGAPAYASQPNPVNEATSVNLTHILSWLPGAATTSHDVYFGTTYPPPFVQNQADSIFSPGTLEYNTTYYWQINEINSSGTTAGAIWSFTTIEAVGMVAHWKMDENSGSIIYDDSGNGNDGTLINMDDEAWIIGVTGNALQFDGIDDYVHVPHSPSIDFTDQDFSISFWLKQSATDRSMTYIIKGTHSDQGTGKRYEVFYPHLSNPGGLIFGDSTNNPWVIWPNINFSISEWLRVGFAIDDNITSPEAIMQDTNFVKGEWVHIVASRIASEDMLYLYANTDLLGYTYDNTGDISQNEDLYIGVSPDEDNTNFEGALDDIRIYNYALSDEEIESIYYGEINNIEEHKVPVTSEIDLKIYPNPSNTKTTIIYSLTQTEKIKLSVYNLIGQEIEVLADQIKPAGKHTIEFDASKLNSGMYIFKLQAGSEIKTSKMLYLK